MKEPDWSFRTFVHATNNKCLLNLVFTYALKFQAIFDTASKCLIQAFFIFPLRLGLISDCEIWFPMSSSKEIIINTFSFFFLYIKFFGS